MMRVFAILLLLVASQEALGHRLGESYLFVNVQTAVEDGALTVGGLVEIHAEDLDARFGADQNLDGKVDRTELQAVGYQVKRHIKENAGLEVNGQTLALAWHKPEVMETRLGKYMTVSFDSAAFPTTEFLGVRYSVLHDQDDPVRGLLIVQTNELIGLDNTRQEVVSAMFDPDQSSFELPLTQPPRPVSFLTYVWEGIWHIWIGFDHVLFLVGLLIPAVYSRYAHTSETADHIRKPAWQVAKIVTLFTIAHSITLGLAALGIIAVPSWLVESIIALSIVVVAANILYPVLERGIGTLTFLFGLFHGIGFASVLERLTLTQGSLLSTLLGFNLGVELGQIVIVALVFPLLFLARNHPLYRPAVVFGGAGFLILIGSVWFVERISGLAIIGI